MSEANIILYVVAYYRMSSDDQTTSIDQQQKEVRRYAQQRGWVIVREYIDEGKSGSKHPEKRVAFHQMVADSGKGEFSAILVYSTSRFGRRNSLDAAPYKAILRDNKVHLETTKGERIDWSTSMGRIHDCLMSEADNQYSVNLGSSVVLGRLSALADGYWPHGAIPFGYDRQLVEGGSVQMVVPRVRNFRKPHSWKLKLVPNAAEAGIIRMMYKEFSERDISMHALCDLLATEVGPSGTGWPYNTLVSTLTNPVYCGDIAFGMRRKGGKGEFKSAAPQIKRDACPAIVPRETWQIVQDKIKARKNGRQVVRNGKRNYPLSGLLVCGHCGHRLTGCSDGPRTYYTCLSMQNRPHLGCRSWKVREDKILPIICRTVANAVDFEVIRAIEAKPKIGEKSEVSGLRDTVASLKKRIARGTENLLMASPDIFGSMQKGLLKWRDELAKAENTLSLALAKVNRSKVEQWAEWWQTVKGKLVTVSEIIWGNRHWQSFPIVPDASLSAALGDKIGRSEISGRYFEVDAAGNVSELVEMEGPVRPAVLAESDTLRDLLKRLNLSVVLSWQPNGKRYFNLTRAVIKAEFGETSLDNPTPVREVVPCRRMNTNAPPAVTRLRSFSRSSLRRSRSAPIAGSPRSSA
jgi:DNA invertase Pin-like site-specific DNA recombinase